MARQTIEELTDDLDGSPADRTVGFGYAGADYELELSEEHAAQLAAVFERYVAAARRVGEQRGSGRRAGGRPTGRRPSGWSAGGRGGGGSGVGAGERHRGFRSRPDLQRSA